MPFAWFFIFCSVALIWGSVMTLIKVLLPIFSPFEIIIFRLAFASLAVIPYFFFRRLQIAKSDYKWFLILAITLYPIYQLGIVVGETQVNAGLAGLLLAFIPIVSTFLAYLFFKEKLNKKQIIGFGIAIIGMFFLTGLVNIFESFNWYILWILLTVFSGAIALNFEKFLLKKYEVLDVLLVSVFLGGFWAVFFLPNSISSFLNASFQNQMLLIYLSIFPVIVGHVLMAFLVKALSMKLASSVLFLVPIISLVFAWQILGEIPTLFHFLGGFAVFLGIFFVVFQKASSTH